MVHFSDAETNEERYCVVVSPNERLVHRFMEPHEVLHIAGIDETDTEIAHERPEYFSDHPATR